MHRQSLGSPSSKLHHHPHGAPVSLLLKDDHPVAAEPSSTSLNNKEQDSKSVLLQKPHHLIHNGNKLHPKPEKYIHLIPLLTLLCFLILYLSSHNPSQKDMAEFNGFNRFSNPIDTSDIIDDDFEQVLKIEKGDVLAIRSMRNLHEINRSKQDGSDSKYHHRQHRKIADF